MPNPEPKKGDFVDGKTASPPSSSTAWIGMAGLGFEFLAAVLVPGAAGYFLDRLLGWSPWLMLAGGLLGFFAGLRLLLRAANRSIEK